MRITKLLAVIVLIASITKVFGQTRIEAEDCTLAGGASNASNSALSGGAYVQLNAGTLSNTFTTTDDAYYNIVVNTSHPGEKYNYFKIDGNSASFGSDVASPYTDIKVGTFVKLAAGSHTIEVEAFWGYIDIDYFELTEVDPSTRFNIAQNLVTPNPSDEAVSLYSFLKDNYGSKIISGVMTLNSMDESTWLKTNTGKEPVILGIDLMHTNMGYTWYDDSEPRNDAIEWYNKNGIPTFTWHWRDPSDQTEDFYTYPHDANGNTIGTTFDSRTILDNTSADYDKIIADIDFIANEFKQLEQQGVPILWRPLHEASGGWFWWGANGAEAYVELWHVMFDRMVNYHGLTNLIWVYTYQAGEAAEWYPGDAYVDIVGQDIYKDGDHSSQIMEFNNTNSAISGNKIVAETECGSFPDPDNLIADEAAWSWFMPWYGDFVRNSTYNSLSLWQKTMEHEYVITLDEMPDLRTYTSSPADDASLKSAEIEKAKISPEFTPSETSYTVYIADGQPVPAINYSTANPNATATVTHAQTIPGTSSISVTSKDQTSSLEYQFTFEYYTPVPDSIAVNPASASMLTEDALSLRAEIFDQYKLPILDNLDWASTGNGLLSTTTGTEVIYTSGTSAESITVTASFGSISSSANITVVQGTAISSPDASNWIAFNTWDDQTGGSGISNGTASLVVDHRQWGYGELWLINTGLNIELEKDVKYLIQIEYQGDADAEVKTMEFGFASTWDNAAVTSFHSSTASVTDGFSNTDFTTLADTVQSTFSGSSNLFIRLSWGNNPEANKPTQEYQSMIKNIKIIPQSGTPTQTIKLFEGWNLVSTYRLSGENLVENVFSCATVVKNFDSTYNAGYADHLNRLKSITPGEGYLVKVENDCTATISGTVEDPSEVNLVAGWNLIGYPLDTESNLEEVLNPILNKVISVKDFQGFYKPNAASSITAFKPGKAYFVNVTEDCSFNW